MLKEDDEWNSGARWRMGEILIRVCVPLQAAHEVFAGKEVKFFSKAFENKSDCVAFLCASLFLSLSLLSFLYALFSPMTRRRIIARRDSCASSSSSSSTARPFPTLLGKFYYSRRHHGGGCVGRFALFLKRIFFLLFLLALGRALVSLCSLLLWLFPRLLRTRFLSFFSPLFIQMRKHIKVFIIS